MSQSTEEAVVGNYKIGYKGNNPLVPYRVFPELFLFEKCKKGPLGLDKLDQNLDPFYPPSSTEDIHTLVINWNEYLKYQHQNNSDITKFFGAIEQPQFRSNLKRLVLIIPSNRGLGPLFTFLKEMLSGGTIEWFICSSIDCFSNLYHALSEDKQKILCSGLKYFEATVKEQQDSDSENLETILSPEFKSLKYLKFKFAEKISYLPTFLFPKNLTSLFIETTKPNGEFLTNLSQILDQSELPNLKHLSVHGLAPYDFGIFNPIFESKTVYSTTLETLYLSFEKSRQKSSQTTNFEASGRPNPSSDSINPTASEGRKTSLKVLTILNPKDIDPEVIGLFIKNCPELKLLVITTIQGPLEKYVEHVPEIWTNSNSPKSNDQVHKKGIRINREHLTVPLAEFYSNLAPQ